MAPYRYLNPNNPKPPPVPRFRSSTPPDQPLYRSPKAQLPSVAQAAGAPVTPPSLGSQAQSQVATQLDPLLKDIATRYNAQAQGVSSAFGGLTNTYASRLAGVAGQTGQMYDQAQAPVSAAAQGINAQLTSLGQAAASREGGALAQAGLPGGAAGPDVNLAQAGAGAGGAAGAIGQAAIDALTTEQKAAMAYAGKLPGFAQLQGSYRTQDALSQLAGEMTQQLATTTAQAPQLYWSIYQQLQDRAQTDKAFAFQVKQYGEQVREYSQNRADNEAKAAAQAGDQAAGKAWLQADTLTKNSDHVFLATRTKNGWQVVDAGKKTDPLTRQRMANAAAIPKRTQVAQQNANANTTRATNSGYVVVGSDKGGRWLVDKATGNRVEILPPIKPGAPKPTKPTLFKGTDGRTWRYDPKTNSAVVVRGQPPAKKSGASTNASGLP